jgi:signal peptidase I
MLINKIFDTVFTGFLIVLLVMLVFVFNHTVVNGDSMRNTYQTGDRLVINLVDRNFARGEIVTVFSDNKGAGFIPNSLNTIWQVFIGQRTILVKRVIGLPGEEIEIIDKKVVIYNSNYPKGFVLEEKYAKNDWICKQGAPLPETSYAKYKIPENSYFVMGDNRGCSQDSRFYKAFSKESILGKVVLKINGI